MLPLLYEITMPATILVLTFLCSFGFVAAAQRRPAHAPALERIGGLLLVVSFVCLGLHLAQAARRGALPFLPDRPALGLLEAGEKRLRADHFGRSVTPSPAD